MTEEEGYNHPWPTADYMTVIVQAFAMRIAYERGLRPSEDILDEALARITSALTNLGYGKTRTPKEGQQQCG